MALLHTSLFKYLVLGAHILKSLRAGSRFFFTLLLCIRTVYIGLVVLACTATNILLVVQS